MNNVNKPLIGLLAIGVALAMPAAFAQEADDFGQAPPTPTEAAPAAPQGQVTWSDLDADGDGNLSRAEAGA
ncbi:MAG: EF-hand domain-containing protein, partial [Luteimonas sp.]